MAAAEVLEDLPSGKRSRTEAKEEDVEMDAPEEEVKEETPQDDPQDAQMPATEEEAPDFGDVDLDDDVSETSSQKMQRANLLMNSEVLQRFANSSDEEEGESRLGPRPRNPILQWLDVSANFFLKTEIFLMQLLKQTMKGDKDDMKKEFNLLRFNQGKKSGMVKS